MAGIRTRIETDIKALHQKCDIVDMNSNMNFREALKNALMRVYKEYDEHMQGLSAIQIGYKSNCALLRYKKGESPIVIYNLDIIWKMGNVKSNEGCLSEGDIRYIVSRPLICKVRYYTIDGTKVEKILPYKKARIFCHEYDHANGVLLQDIGVVAE